MWNLLKAEIIYNKNLILICHGIILLVCLYELAISEVRIGYVLIGNYTLTVFWNVTRNKENRDSQEVRLPLSVRQIAFIRIILIVLACISMSVFYYVTYIIFNLRGPDEPIKLAAYFGIILFGFANYFFIRDLSVNVLKSLMFRKDRNKSTLIMIFLGIDLVIVYAMVYAIIQTKYTGKVHIILYYLDKINMLADPPAAAFQILIFLLFSLFLAYSTIFTFSWRKSYLN